MTKENGYLPNYTLSVKEYRGLSKKDTIGLDRFMELYPEYCQFMVDFHAKFEDRPRNEFPMGADFSFYFEVTEKILKNKYKHVIEYGAGFTTRLLSHIKHNIDWDLQVTTYENVQYYIDLIKSNGFDPDNTIKFVDFYYDNTKKENIVYCKHDLDIHKDVDFIIIDGPDHSFVGDTTKEGKTINGMYGILSDYLNKDIDLSIDGRQLNRSYYNLYYNKDF